MTIRLQQFGYRESRYERPTQTWVCGWAAEGRPCAMGPDGAGRCSAKLQSECKPVRKGDRWHCTRPDAFGGTCESGPRPDGTCCHPEPEHLPCQPRLSLRAKRGRLVWAVTTLTAGLLALLIASPLGPNYLNPGPLTSHHAVVELLAATGGGAYCALCHAKDTSTAGLMQPVKDSACLNCHIAEAHHPALSTASVIPWPEDDFLGQAPMAERCTSCHREHRGRDHELTRVLDGACTDCHKDLSPWRRGDAAAGHMPTLAPPRVDPAIDRRSANRVTSFASDHPEPRVLASPHIDATPLRFEHHVHMATDDTMQDRLIAWTDALRTAGATAAEIPVRKTDTGRLQLTCVACHRTDVGGRYMLPIRFENHCVQCHTLGNKSVGSSDYAIPHGATIRDFVRLVGVESAAAKSEAISDEQGEDPEPSRGPKRGPTRRGPGGSRPSSAPAADIPLETRIDLEMKKLAQRLRTDCGKCHNPAADPTEIENPAIPTRWFSAAVFGHKTHAFMDCTDCHENAGYTTPPDTPDYATLRWTGRTKELMLPKIEMCRDCHAPNTAEKPVRHDCALCHEYHAPERDLRLTLSKLKREADISSGM